MVGSKVGLFSLLSNDYNFKLSKNSWLRFIFNSFIINYVKNAHQKASV